MQQEQFKEEFEKNVEFLKKTIPQDKIYEMAEKFYMAAMFFMFKWSDWEDVEDYIKHNPTADYYIGNFSKIQAQKRDQNYKEITF